MSETQNENIAVQDFRLGKLPAKSSLKALLFEDFLKADTPTPPPAYNFWAKRTPFQLRTFGNTQHGCCTRASQAIAAMRMERVETRQSPKITDDEVLRVYYDMTGRLYGGGDTGAYETDALSEWRKPDLTFKDTKGRPLTIDAFTRINHFDHNAVRQAIFATAAKGIKVCFNLPSAWSRVVAPQALDIPEGQALIGEWMPGSWGGHSLFTGGYNERGLILSHTWGIPDQVVTWRACSVYMDETHFIIDSINAWRKRPAASTINFNKLKEAVNAVSEQKII